MPNTIPINPKLPAKFDDTPNDQRSKSQLDAWWDHPYCISHPNGEIEVRCLNGGAWDRSSWLGTASTYDEACELAEKAQAKWVAMRSKPIFYVSFEPPFNMVRLEQRPDLPQTVVASFDTMEELNAYCAEEKKQHQFDN